MIDHMFAFSWTAPPFLDGSVITYWSICALAVLLMAIAKSGFGGAIASLSAPLMLTILPARETLAILLPLYMVTDIWAILIWRGYCYWRILFWMVLFAIIGQVLGFLLISMINDEMLKAMIGAIAILIGCRYFIRLNAPSEARLSRKLRKHIPARASFWCSLSGFSSFISLTGGIPVQIFLLPLRMHRYLVVGTSAWFFFSINIAKVPFFLQLGMFTPSTLFITISLIPVIPIGVIIGKWLARNISDRLFYHLVHAALAFLGLRLVWGIAATAFI
ncbi:sulfite exporter TauE/SafE family protein [Alphaproteobacteria bacterium]|jgi:uncharacterized membrane protein YfcA|nr:sulfite exporter TauE/SafE family protein [Alphaproteobacteria bacterium]